MTALSMFMGFGLMSSLLLISSGCADNHVEPQVHEGDIVGLANQFEGRVVVIPRGAQGWALHSYRPSRQDIEQCEALFRLEYLDAVATAYTNWSDGQCAQMVSTLPRLYFGWIGPGKTSVFVIASTEFFIDSLEGIYPHNNPIHATPVISDRSWDFWRYYSKTGATFERSWGTVIRD